MTVLRLLSNHEIMSLEPNSALADGSSPTVPLKLVCPGLLTLDADMRLAPGLAERWETSPDHRVFRFHLRPGLRFHTGRPVDAESVVWNFDRIFDARVHSLLARDYADLELVKAVTREVVEFRFHRPFPAFPYHLGWRTYITDDSLIQPVGAGPFRAVEWKDCLRLRRYEHYHEPGRPLVDEIVIRPAPDAGERLDLLERGEADILESVPAAGTELHQRGVLEIGAVRSPRKIAVIFNCAEAPFADLRMRRAVAYALDRDRLRLEVLGGRGRRVDGIYPADDPWAEALEAHPLDLARARALVGEAGYAGGLKVKAVMSNPTPVPQLAAGVAEALAGIGIVLDIRGYDDPPWWPMIYLHSSWQMAFQDMPARPHPDSLFSREFASGGAFNAARYRSPELDAVVDRARHAVDGDQQRALYKQAQRIVHADVPVLPLCATDVYVGWRPGVRGVKPHPLGFLNLHEVSVDR